MLAVLAPIGSLAAGVIKPDSACADEAKYKSLDGLHKAALTVINNSDETVKVYWLNYQGKRTFYRDLAPRTSYVQETWLTHPWVISSLAGDCYRFLVMNSLQQSVTVAPEGQDPEATVINVPAPTVEELPTINTSTTAPVAVSETPAVGSPGTGSPGPTTGETSPDYSWLLIMGVLAAVAAVLIAISFATGRTPWIRRGGKGS
jgi:hypothetical protein